MHKRKHPDRNKGGGVMAPIVQLGRRGKRQEPAAMRRRSTDAGVKARTRLRPARLAS